MARLVLLGFLAVVFWLFRRDVARRRGVSTAIWIPTFWLGILASRPLSTWLGIDGLTGDYAYSIEGSPADRYFFLSMIIAAFFVVSRRQLNWGPLIATNWPIFLFYSFLLVSVLWADSSLVSFKRWFKDFGNIFVALVILTEEDPQQAMRAVFVRCGYLLIPLSIIFIRYFPDLGRRYSIHTGLMEATGVTFQKNSLGVLVLVCCLVTIWDWFEHRHEPGAKDSWVEKYLPFVILGMGAFLLRTSDSKTSMLCLAIGGTIIAGTRLPFVRRYVSSMGRYAIAGILVLFLLDSAFGIKEFILESLGRDATFTGRTDVWKVLLDLNTDPIFGTGFCSFWSDAFYRSKLPYWVAFSAHNGYVEAYLDGGMIGVSLLIIMLLGVAAKINRQLALSGSYAVVRFAVLLITIIGDFSESHFARMGPLWFMFLLCALEFPRQNEAGNAQAPSNPITFTADRTVPTSP